MIKKLAAVCAALITAVVISVCSFAAPNYNSVTGSKSIAIVNCQNWLIESTGGKVTHDELEAGYTWAVFENGKYITATSTTSDDMGYQFWYDEAGTFTCDMYSGGKVTRIAGTDTGSAGTTESGGGSGGSSAGATDMSGIIRTVSSGVKGTFGIAKGGFDFILKNALCMFMVSISFAGVAIGFVARAMKTSRK